MSFDPHKANIELVKKLLAEDKATAARAAAVAQARVWWMNEGKQMFGEQSRMYPAIHTPFGAMWVFELEPLRGKP